MNNINVVRIKAVANALNDLLEKVVFVGGATTSFYPDRQILEVRPTDDVDVIVEILSYKNRVELEKKLLKIGFTNDIESGIICRYKIKGVVVDIMPTNEPSIGFQNIWYPDGFTNSIEFEIEKDFRIRILSPAYFIATKLEAHKSRGNNDGRTSQDFEDIIFVLENRESIWNEMIDTDEKLSSYLKNEFKDLLDNPNIKEWISCHVERNNSNAINYIIENIYTFIKA